MWSNAFSPHGREAQSMAFFSAPGIERLYPGDEQDGVRMTDRVLFLVASGG
jgi:hypothetical protein